MLVLTRKTEEKIQIGPDVTITVLRVKGRSVQIGIEAPSRVLVLRGELAAAADRRAEGDDALGPTSKAASSMGTSFTPEPAHEETEPEEHHPAPRRSYPPHESCASGADDLRDAQFRTSYSTLAITLARLAMAETDRNSR